MQPNQPSTPVDLAAGKPGAVSNPPPPPSTTPALLMTAAIFFALGFALAYMVFGLGSDGDVSENELQAAVSVRLTEIAPTPAPTATPMPRQPIEVLLTNYSPVIGPADAPVTMVEFSDYMCPYCVRFHNETFKPLIEHYGDLVRFVYREFPVIGDDYTVEIGLAAMCINEQGKYWEYTDLIWADQEFVYGDLQNPNRTSTSDPIINPDATVLTDLAKDVGADIEAFTACYTERRYMDEINLDLEAGISFGILGTPMFYIEGQPLVGNHGGARPIEIYMEYIDAVLISKGITPPEHPDNISTVPNQG